MLEDQEINRIRGLSDEALLGEIGRAVLKHRDGGLQARPPSLAKLIAEARTWLAGEQYKLRAAICNDPRIRAIATSEPGARAKLIRVVADAISAVLVYVPAGTLAEILVRDGIPKYCEAIWQAGA